MEQENLVYNTKYRRYSTVSLLKMLFKLDKDSELHHIIMIILRNRTNCDHYSKEAQSYLEKQKELRLKAYRVHFGSKDESYFTEEEMLKEYVEPTYEELSPVEQKLYDYDDEMFYPENYFNE